MECLRHFDLFSACILFALFAGCDFLYKLRIKTNMNL